MNLENDFDKIFSEIEKNLLTHNYDGIHQNVSKLIFTLTCNKGLVTPELANFLVPRIQSVLDRLQIVKDALGQSLEEIQRTLSILERYED